MIYLAVSYCLLVYGLATFLLANRRIRENHLYVFTWQSKCYLFLFSPIIVIIIFANVVTLGGILLLGFDNDAEVDAAAEHYAKIKDNGNSF